MSQQVLHALPASDAPDLFDVESTMPAVEAFMDRLALCGLVDLTGTMAKAQLSSKGRRVRARLALHACAHFKVPVEQAIMWASAIELLHNATLIHDDIQDGDRVRRGKPTTWAKHGKEQAINAGDFMLMLPFLAIRNLPSPILGTMCVLIADYATRIVRGQVNEMSLREAGRYESHDYLSACEGKTGALLALPVVGAALLGGHTEAHAEVLGEPFTQLGVLFQLQDDLVDLFGDKGRGEIGCDIYEGKVSALLVALLEIAPEYRVQALSIIEKPREDTTRDDVLLMKEIYEKSGALDLALRRIEAMERRVLGSAEVRAEPGLHAVAAQLSELALRPIHHLLHRESRR